MSVINQMLIDLDRRRAEPGGASALSAYLRPLPALRKFERPLWLVNLAAAIVIGTLCGFAIQKWVGAGAQAGSAARVVPGGGDVATRPVAAPIVRDARDMPPALAHGERDAATIITASVPGSAVIDVPVVELGVFGAARGQAGGDAVGLASVVSADTRDRSHEQTPAARRDPPTKNEAAPQAALSRAVEPETVTSTTPLAPLAAQPAAPSATNTSGSPDARGSTAPSEASHAAPKRALVERRVSRAQERENDYRRAVNLLDQGRRDDAQAVLTRLLAEQPGHDGARQALIGMLLQSKKIVEAEALADERLQRAPDHSGFATIAARLKFERGDLPAALETLRRSLPHAQSHADYQAFMAAILQRLGRHAEAIDHFRAALTLNPGAGVWHMGLAISLQALERTAEAQDAFRHARASAGLAPELAAFIDQRLAQLHR